MMSAGINLVMTVIGFTVSTMFIVFVCTRLICARIQYISARRSFRMSSRSDLNSLERGGRGVESFAAANFPTKKYSDPFFSCAKDAQCIVCLSEYHADDTLRILPFCGHFFHSSCIDIWLQQHCTCPVCRVSLREMCDKRCLMQPMFSSAVQLSSRADNTHRMSPTNDSQPTSIDNEQEAEQNNSNTNENSPAGSKSLGNRQFESPSDV
ncbi:RING-H2 finger protein ATL10-like [Rutidosis leptorrhynchoides]|uniref:RING-H2 finger protein ATL10-like n=1 Tax=Rutidosis leptorrhynchoides TaxID=125765 RepID=UPI003A98E697